MIVYNLSMKVDHSIHHEWLNWQRNDFSPAVMATGHFTEHQFFRLLDQDEEDGFTYVQQYFAKGHAHYLAYINGEGATHIEEAMNRWKGGLLIFSSVMETVK